MVQAATTVVQATPSLWHGLLDARPDRLHGIRALVGGEPLTRELADRLGALTTHVTNLYGPTETTIWSLAADVEADTEAPPIGVPLPGIGARLLVADSGAGQPFLQGVAHDVRVAAGWDRRLGGFRKPAPGAPDAFWRNLS